MEALFIEHGLSMKQNMLKKMVAHLCNLIESEFTHLLSTFPLVGEDVKSTAVEEFKKMKDS